MLMRRIPDSLDERFLFDITAVLAWPLSFSTPPLSQAAEQGGSLIHPTGSYLEKLLHV